ncbi:super-infection exclusion protein B [Lactobacillus kalixensis]|nr:super-infection exclusion protein B [Lactobacillus kalixensis]
MEWIKTAWEALKSDMKTRLGIAIGFSAFLVGRSYIEQLPGGKNIFAILAVPAFLICIIFWVYIILDLSNTIFNRIQEKRLRQIYTEYILNLTGNKYSIVRTLYDSPQHQARLKYNDTDVRDLMKKGIIELSQTNNVVLRHELNDPTVNFLLTSSALEVVENNSEKFKSNQSA